jgi:hypothetical protein
MVVWRFQLRDGRVELASSAARESMLGNLLVERGLLTEGELALALAECRRRHTRLGQTLVRAALVSPEQIFDVLAAKAEGLIEDALSWTEGRFFFDDEAVGRRRPTLRTDVDLGAVIDRAQTTQPVTVTDDDVLEVSEIVPPGEAA